MDRDKQIEKRLKEKCELVDVISYAMRDWDDYRDECYEEEIPLQDSFEDFIADGILAAGYRKQGEGEWESVEGDVIFKCSICDAEISTSWDYENDDMWRFCPCCGAKMKGGDE